MVLHDAATAIMPKPIGTQSIYAMFALLVKDIRDRPMPKVAHDSTITRPRPNTLFRAAKYSAADTAPIPIKLMRLPRTSLLPFKTSFVKAGMSMVKGSPKKLNINSRRIIARMGKTSMAYLKPSPISPKALRPSSCGGILGERMKVSDIKMARKPAEFIKKQTPSPQRFIIMPPKAGPIKRVPFIAVEFNATAFVMSSGGTSLE